jgi:Flp pilus assembly protein TadD
MGALGVSRRWTGLAVAVAGLALVACTPKTPNPDEADRLRARAAYERGLADVREGRPALGLAALQEAVALESQNAQYHNALGLILLDLTRPEALAEFQKAVELDPNHAEAHHNAGVALAEASRWEEAIVEYRKALAIPTFSTPDLAHHNLAWALFNLGRNQEALESLQFAIRLNPTLPAPYYTLGLVLVRQGQPEHAKVAFRRARELGPDSPFGGAAVQHLKALGDGG